MNHVQRNLCNELRSRIAQHPEFTRAVGRESTVISLPRTFNRAIEAILAFGATAYQAVGSAELNSKSIDATEALVRQLKESEKHGHPVSRIPEVFRECSKRVVSGRQYTLARESSQFLATLLFDLPKEEEPRTSTRRVKLVASNPSKATSAA
jgi:hypothetical protein